MRDNIRLVDTDFGTNESRSRRPIDIEEERRALRTLIDQIGAQPATEDDHGFYRKAGRFIARPMMKPRWPGDTGY